MHYALPHDDNAMRWAHEARRGISVREVRIPDPGSTDHAGCVRVV
jgi:hypothetical protein